MFFDWVNVRSGNYPILATNIFSVPNAGKRTYGALKYYLSEGLRSGVPDILVAIPVHPYHGFFIEMKRQGNKPSPDQLRVLSNLSAAGYRTAVCFSGTEAIDLTEQYLSTLLSKSKAKL